MNKRTWILILVISHILCLILGYSIAMIQLRSAEQESPEAIVESNATEAPSEPEEIDIPAVATEETESPKKTADTTDATTPVETAPAATQPPVTEPPATTPIENVPGEGIGGEYELDRDI